LHQIYEAIKINFDLWNYIKRTIFIKIEITYTNNYFENMKKIKIPSRKKKITNPDKYSFEKIYNPGKLKKIIFYALVFILPVITSFIYLRYAFQENKVFSFPLDDPWIHLTFAKNLAEYFSFSYFKNEMVTAGSTSPLYTFIAAIGFLITKNEMAISYILGMTFFALAALSFYKLSIFEFEKEGYFALLCTGIFIIDKWMNFISLSGMETTMFIFILVLCSYFYKKRNAVPFAVTLGLILWTRPDGIVFIIAVVIDYILNLVYSRSQFGLTFFSNKELKKIAIIFLGITGLYFGMNFILSGSLLPNTYSAKLMYYTPDNRDRWDFLSIEVWEYFKTGAYYVLMIGFIFSFLKFIYDLSKKTYNQNTLYILFILGLVLIYFLKLPYAHRFGRYMMPIIPFFILVSTIGFRDLARFINNHTQNVLFSKIIFYILLAITYFIGIKNYEDNKELYASQCKYIYDRQVKAAKWIKENTNENDVIATHDVGAIGFYSDRKIVDVVGLVTPELIKSINDKDYSEVITKYMKDKGVTYVAFMKEWCRVSNQNPVFTSTSPNAGEVIEVYKFYPDRTHILSREANSLIMNATALLSQRAGQQVIYVTNRVISLEPKSSYAYYLRAYGFRLLKDNDNFEKSLLKAVELFPDLKEAHQGLAVYYKEAGRYPESKEHLVKLLELEPENTQIKNYLNNVNHLINTKENKSGN
jgi:tetratricopeptide (TPR) repeat protein